MNDATSIVGMSLQERKTTFVGKLIKFNAKLERADDDIKQNVKSGYWDRGATRPVSLATKVRSKKEQTATLQRERNIICARMNRKM
jgi:hypothetical protein